MSNCNAGFWGEHKSFATKKKKAPPKKKPGRKLNVKTTNLHIVCEFAFTVHGKIEMMASNMLQEDFGRIVLLRS